MQQIRIQVFECYYRNNLALYDMYESIPNEGQAEMGNLDIRTQFSGQKCAFELYILCRLW